MKRNSTLQPGFSLWESETLVILRRFEKRFRDRIPELELRSRALERLTRVRIQSLPHLEVVLGKIVRQVLLDFGKEQSRHYRHHLYEEAADWPAAEPALTETLRTRLDELLLDEDSPLSGSDKALLQIALGDPVSFLHASGEINQSRLAGHLGVDQRTVGRRWQRLLQKIEVWRRNQVDWSL